MKRQCALVGLGLVVFAGYLAALTMVFMDVSSVIDDINYNDSSEVINNILGGSNDQEN